MAIVNTLERCLESPYLVRDEAARSEVGRWIAQARDRVETARALLESGGGDQADVSFFSYEGMFAALRALVYREGYRERGLRCLLLACEALYVRSGRLDAGHLHAFEYAQGLKQPPAKNLAAAERFVAAVEGLLGAAVDSA
jgi:uncharacterized protein (UPF0332 family)